MRILRVLMIMLVGLTVLSAVENSPPVKLQELKLTDGRTLTKVEFVAYSATGVLAKWEGGRGQIKYEMLPDLERVEALKRRQTPAPPSPKNTPGEGRAPLVKLSYDDSSITITNSGSQGWSEAVVYINGEPPFSFKATLDAPKVGMSIRIPLTQFIKQDGSRFNPDTYALTVIWVGGNGFDFEKYVANRR